MVATYLRRQSKVRSIYNRTHFIPRDERKEEGEETERRKQGKKKRKGTREKGRKEGTEEGMGAGREKTLPNVALPRPQSIFEWAFT